MPLTVIALGRVIPGKEAELPQILKIMAAKSLQESGTETYTGRPPVLYTT